MALKIYNTLTRRKEDFQTIAPGQVRMYVCGPTVYNKAHIGHAMSALVFDIIRRYLEFRGYQVQHAMNFTDGLDGLATIISMTAFGVYGIIALMQNQVFLGRFCFTIVGALAGFLWFNANPARLIMGDTGSQALGASLAIVALMTGRWLFLPLIAIIPMAELFSVMIQVAYFKITKGKRIFKRAPIHHHFELIGWTESQIVMRFWIIELVGAMLGLGLSFIR